MPGRRAIFRRDGPYTLPHWEIPFDRLKHPPVSWSTRIAEDRMSTHEMTLHGVSTNLRNESTEQIGWTYLFVVR